jgi:segregation and condensation protein A
MSAKYKIKLPIFEGPFDLLLFLIRKNEIDIYNIPIADITHQYLEYLEMLKLLDLDIAGEFIEMVATLMLIKVRMLLPGQEIEGQTDIEDPRSKLVSQLLEYQQYKEVASEMGVLENERKKIYKNYIFKTANTEVEEAEDVLFEASLFDLLTAFKTALDNMPKVTVHKVNVIKVTIEEQVDFIFKKMKNKSFILFREMTSAIKTKMELIVTFIALLDLMRLKFISAVQPDAFGEIRLMPEKKLDLDIYLKIRDKELLSESVNNN